MRARYTWHLRPPFNDEFDCSHWWEDQTDVNEIAPVGILYELARRHPLVGEVRSKFRHAKWYGQEFRAPLVGAAKERVASQAFDDLGQESGAIHCLCLIGLKSWPTLGGRDRDYWEDCAGNLKGLECRDELERCDSITLSALADILIKRVSKLKRKGKGMTNEEFNKLVAKDWVKSPPSSEELGAALVQEALDAHLHGHLLIAVAPDLVEEDAKSLLAKTYRRHRVLNPAPKQRARSENWLPLISEFEHAEASGDKSKSQAFTRYRRALDLIRFPPDKRGCVFYRCRHIIKARAFMVHEYLAAIDEELKRVTTTPSN